MEALFSTSSEDLTYKLRIRVSILLGADYDPDFLYEFIGKAYAVRSGLVHGKVDNKSSDSLMVINSMKYGLYDVASELEQITRLSILKMLSLFRYHNYKQGNENLVKVIDRVAIGEARSTLGPRIPKLS